MSDGVQKAKIKIDLSRSTSREEVSQELEILSRLESKLRSIIRYQKEKERESYERSYTPPRSLPPPRPTFKTYQGQFKLCRNAESYCGRNYKLYDTLKYFVSRISRCKQFNSTKLRMCIRPQRHLPCKHVDSRTGYYDTRVVGGFICGLWMENLCTDIRCKKIKKRCLKVHILYPNTNNLAFNTNAICYNISN
jgi:hypothetical protein